MNVLDAIERAKNSENIKTLKDFFTGSAFTSLKEGTEAEYWTILFYNPKTNRVFDCNVKQDSITIGDEVPALYATEELRTDSMKITLEKALETAKKDLSKTIVSTLVSFHMKDKLLWSFGIVATDITATLVDIDAETGEVTKKEETKLIRQL